jgi:hypothetical protein
MKPETINMNDKLSINLFIYESGPIEELTHYTPSIKLLSRYGGACYDRLIASNTYWLPEEKVMC